jgi:hypothetical protein
MRRDDRRAAGRHTFFRGWRAGPAALRAEVFYLAYHLHWSWEEVMGMDGDERSAMVALLAERIEAENAARVRAEVTW